MSVIQFNDVSGQVPNVGSAGAHAGDMPVVFTLNGVEKGSRAAMVHGAAFKVKQSYGSAVGTPKARKDYQDLVSVVRGALGPVKVRKNDFVDGKIKLCLECLMVNKEGMLGADSRRWSRTDVLDFSSTGKAKHVVNMPGQEYVIARPVVNTAKLASLISAELGSYEKAKALGIAVPTGRLEDSTAFLSMPPMIAAEYRSMDYSGRLAKLAMQVAMATYNTYNSRGANKIDLSAALCDARVRRKARCIKTVWTNIRDAMDGDVFFVGDSLDPDYLSFLASAVHGSSLAMGTDCGGGIYGDVELPYEQGSTVIFATTQNVQLAGVGDEQLTHENWQRSIRSLGTGSWLNCGDRAYSFYITYANRMGLGDIADKILYSAFVLPLVSGADICLPYRFKRITFDIVPSLVDSKTKSRSTGCLCFHTLVAAGLDANRIKYSFIDNMTRTNRGRGGYSREPADFRRLALRGAVSSSWAASVLSSAIGSRSEWMHAQNMLRGYSRLDQEHIAREVAVAGIRALLVETPADVVLRNITTEGVYYSYVTSRTRRSAEDVAVVGSIEHVVRGLYCDGVNSYGSLAALRDFNGWRIKITLLRAHSMRADVRLRAGGGPKQPRLNRNKMNFGGARARGRPLQAAVANVRHRANPVRAAPKPQKMPSTGPVVSSEKKWSMLAPTDEGKGPGGAASGSISLVGSSPLGDPSTWSLRPDDDLTDEKWTSTTPATVEPMQPAVVDVAAIAKMIDERVQKVVVSSDKKIKDLEMVLHDQKEVANAQAMILEEKFKNERKLLDELSSLKESLRLRTLELAAANGRLNNLEPQHVGQGVHATPQGSDPGGAGDSGFSTPVAVHPVEGGSDTGGSSLDVPTAQGIQPIDPGGSPKDIKQGDVSPKDRKTGTPKGSRPVVSRIPVSRDGRSTPPGGERKSRPHSGSGREKKGLVVDPIRAYDQVGWRQATTTPELLGAPREVLNKTSLSVGIGEEEMKLEDGGFTILE